MEAIQFEKIFGDKKHLRKRYERAMEKTHDAPEEIAASWIQFEREEGDLVWVNKVFFTLVFTLNIFY